MRILPLKGEQKKFLELQMRALVLPSIGVLTGAFKVAVPRYPSSQEMKQLKNAAISFGKASCSSDSSSQSCREYQRYWSFGSATSDDVNVNRKQDLAKAINSGFGKLLIISVGQTFRSGGRLSVEAGTEESIGPQHDAVMSHMAFSHYMQNRYNIKTDFIVETYPSPYCQDEAHCKLSEWYPKGTTIKLEDMITDDPPESYFEKRALIPSSKRSLFGYERLLNLGISRAQKISEYGGVLFIRADLKLKPGFFHYFDLFDKITFSFISERRARRLTGLPNGNLRPQIGDMLVYVPRKHSSVFNKKGQFKLYHDAYNFFDANRIGFMVNTYHDSNSKNNANPLYEIVNRPATNSTADEGRHYDDFDGIWANDDAYTKYKLTRNSGINYRR